MEMKEDIRKVPNVCNYCRKLMKKPNCPEILKLYRNEMLCLTVDVEEASKLRFREFPKGGMYYEKYDPPLFIKRALLPPIETVEAFK